MSWSRMDGDRVINGACEGGDGWQIEMQPLTQAGARLPMYKHKLLQPV